MRKAGSASSRTGCPPLAAGFFKPELLIAGLYPRPVVGPFTTVAIRTRLHAAAGSAPTMIGRHARRGLGRARRDFRPSRRRHRRPGGARLPRSRAGADLLDDAPSAWGCRRRAGGLQPPPQRVPQALPAGGVALPPPRPAPR